jgi:hypothetical protein
VKKKDGDLSLDEAIESMLKKVDRFQDQMDELETGLRMPKTLEGLKRTYQEAGIQWSITYAEALHIYACLSLMMGLLIAEDKADYVSDIDTTGGIESLPLIAPLYEELVSLMYKEQRRLLENEDH